MKILITAGSTMCLIDDVRGIGNIFTGQTGTRLATEYARLGHEVVLITSNPGLVHTVCPTLTVVSYVTFDDLKEAMERCLTGTDFDLMIHSAAINDYRPAGLFEPHDGGLSQMNTDGKVSSGATRLYLKLVPTEKLAPLIRRAWGFTGILVTFKLQSQISDAELVRIATQKIGDADIVVANNREWKNDRAILVSRGHLRPWHIQPIPRAHLASALLPHAQSEAA